MPTHIFTDEEKENLREQMLEAGFPLLKQYGITLLDPVIGIVSGSERKEQAVGMLRWIFEENAGVAAAFSAEEYKAMISQEETGRKDDGKNV